MSLCTEGRNHDRWKSKTTALLASEEMLPRICIKTTSSLHLKPFLKILFQFKENVPRREQNLQHSFSCRAARTLPMLLLAAVLPQLLGFGGRG